LVLEKAALISLLQQVCDFNSGIIAMIEAILSAMTDLL